MVQLRGWLSCLRNRHYHQLVRLDDILVNRPELLFEVLDVVLIISFVIQVEIAD